MSFIDDAVSTAKTVGKTVSKKTEEIIIISRKKLHAIELENKLDNYYGQLGRRYYAILTGEEATAQDEDGAAAAEIQKLNEELAAVKKDIEDLSHAGKSN